MRIAEELLTIPEIVAAARANLSPQLWDYACGGAESEVTLRRNRSAFDRLAFRPRVLRGVAQRDASATFLGHRLAVPVMLAPVGSIHNYHPDGALACARAAHRAGSAALTGTLSAPSLEDVRRGSDGPLFFQMYVRGDREWMRALARRAEESGFDALALTVDSSAYSRRERDIHNRYLDRGGAPRPNLAGMTRAEMAAGEHYQADLTWEDVDWLKSATRLPLMLKGIQHPEDARLAVEHGVEVVYVSNHGGRQLDHGVATIDVLPEIVASVAGRAEVVVDSGIMRGTDVLKALALGARAVFIGKLMCWGLGAAGEDGIVRTLELLHQEMLLNMANLGVRSLAELGPDLLVPAAPPDPAPWPVGPLPLPRAD